jgi:hypothetical protein
MRTCLAAAIALVACITPHPANETKAAPVRARATFALGYLTRIDLTMSEGYALTLLPVGRAFAVGSQPIVRRTPQRPNVEGIVLEWPSDSRQVWDGDTGEVLISRLEGKQTGAAAEWIGEIAGHILARLVRRGDPVGAEVTRTLDLDFAGGIYNAGESTSGY